MVLVISIIHFVIVKQLLMQSSVKHSGYWFMRTLPYTDTASCTKLHTLTPHVERSDSCYGVLGLSHTKSDRTLYGGHKQEVLFVGITKLSFS